MVDVCLNLKVPAAEKLIDYTASGIGAIAGPMLATRKARKDAETKLIAANAEADSLKIIAQAQSEARQLLVEPGHTSSGTLEIDANGITQRIQFQEQKRQANIAATVREAAAELGDTEAPEHEPDPDWTARFFDSVQDVSSEDMQKLWAKVLSGEIQGPGSTSMRTLDVIKNMTARDAEMFQKVCSYVILDFLFKPDEVAKDQSPLLYEDLLVLEDAGLINADADLVKTIRFKRPSESTHLPYQDRLLEVRPTDETVEINIPAYLLTPAGKELHRFADCTPRLGYLKSLAHFLWAKNCELSSARIIEILPDGDFKRAEFSRIEPESSKDAPP